MDKDKKAQVIPKCKLEWRDGKAHIVCDTKTDQKIAYAIIDKGIVLEVKPEVEEIE